MRKHLKPPVVADRTEREPETVCAICGKPERLHFGWTKHCPLSRTVKPGSRFSVRTKDS